MMRYRTLFGLALLLGTLNVSAQEPRADSHYYRTTQPLDLGQFKHLTGAIHDIDPNAKVTHSDDMRIVHVKANVSVSDTEIRNAIASTRIAVDAGVPDMRAYLPEAGPDHPPVYIVTGDDAGDLQRYRASAQAWNRNHPERAVAVEPAHLLDR